MLRHPREPCMIKLSDVCVILATCLDGGGKARIQVKQMKFFYFLYNLIIDALFPLSDIENDLQNLTPERANAILPPSPPVPIANAQAILAYKDERVAKLIWHIKYKHDYHAVSIGGFLLFHQLLKSRNNIPGAKRILTVIVPMPITARRRSERGYNQCELLVEEIARLDKKKDFMIRNDLLLRTVHASRQTLKDRKHRLISAKGIFSVNEKVAHINMEQASKVALPIQIIVIDDVITTGSTMNEAIATLRQAGFTDVHGLSLAH